MDTQAQLDAILQSIHSQDEEIRDLRTSLSLCQNRATDEPQLQEEILLHIDLDAVAKPAPLTLTEEEY